MNVVETFLKGVIIGIGNIIPGVSGGTLALVLGIYERLIAALNQISGETVRVLLSVVTFRPLAWQRLKTELRRIDAFFLAVLGAGAVIAVVLLSRLISFLLLQHHDPTYGFFMGLILFSIVVPYRLLRRKTWGCLISAVLAAFLVYGLTNLQTSEEKLANARLKFKIEQAQAAADLKSGNQTATHRLSYDTGQLLGFFAAGAIAISAMILPGISGSFLMILLGVYFDLLRSISEIQLQVLGVFAAGCLVGIVVFTKLLHFVLDRYHDLTMSFLVGLMIGSLFEIWPFKHSAVVGDSVIYLQNTLPDRFGSNEILTAICFVGGGMIVIAFMAFEQRKAVEE